MRKVETSDPKFYYFVSGENPKLLIHSGTHGDEYEVTDFVIETILKYEKDLPPFIYVPVVSPSAVERKTRVNESGTDMNRRFFTDSNDPEVQANIEIIKNQKFDLFISFHEDHEFEKEYYVYDVGQDKHENNLVLRHNQLLSTKGILLLNRIDSHDDPNLGYLFVDGYRKFVHKNNVDHGIAGWILDRGIAREYLMPEIPMRANSEVKKMIVDSFFSEVILKMF